MTVRGQSVIDLFARSTKSDWVSTWLSALFVAPQKGQFEGPRGRILLYGGCPVR